MGRVSSYHRHHMAAPPVASGDMCPLLGGPACNGASCVRPRQVGAGALGPDPDPDSTHMCVAGVGSFLLYSVHEGIRGIPLDPNDKSDALVPVSGTSLAVGIDFHAGESTPFRRFPVQWGSAQTPGFWSLLRP